MSTVRYHGRYPGTALEAGAAAGGRMKRPWRFVARTGDSSMGHSWRPSDRATDEEVNVHAVAVRVTIKDRDAAAQNLRDRVVPRVSQAPGFVHGYWTWKDNTGLAMVVFETEDAATSMSQQIPNMITTEVTLESVEVREVVAHA